ncbi:MAG: alanine racemase [Lentisphaerae bacterium]|nr:alanine racemase [Lentisphaerota bacterium]
MDMKHILRVELSQAAIRHNSRVIRDRLGDGVKLCAVVKSDAYGHGIDLLWPILAEVSDCLAVASAAEAIELRTLGYEGALLMLFCARSCGVGSDAVAVLAELIRQHVALTVTDPADVELIRLAAAAACSEALIHVEVDSGMTRSGVSPDHARNLLELIRESEGLRLDGLYTQLAAADDEDSTASVKQLDIFYIVVNDSSINSNVCVHCANSAAAVTRPETKMDMVRVGLMLYGSRPAPHVAPDIELRPVLRLVSHLMQIHEVSRGTQVGYGLTYTCTRPSRIGLVPGGYGDGYPRALSDTACVRVGDTMAPVVGRVSMDQISVDLTDVPGAIVGDEVELISNNAQAPNSAANLAAAAGTIPYEILTNMALCRRMDRVLME